MPWNRGRLRSFLAGPGAAHADVVHVGTGESTGAAHVRIKIAGLSRLPPERQAGAFSRRSLCHPIIRYLSERRSNDDGPLSNPFRSYPGEAGARMARPGAALPDVDGGFHDRRGVM
jgi:hypothetical protein